MNEWQSMMVVKIWMTTMTLKAKEDHLVVSILVLYMLRHKSHRVDRLLKMRLLETKFIYFMEWWVLWYFHSNCFTCSCTESRKPLSYLVKWYWLHWLGYLKNLTAEKKLYTSPESSTIELFFRKGKPVTLRLLLELVKPSIAEQWYA